MASKRRRSEGSPKTPVFRFSLDVRFQTEIQKEAFITRLGNIRDLLSPEGGEKVHNYELLSHLFSLAETRPIPLPSQTTDTPQSPASTTNMLGSNGEMLHQFFVSHILKCNVLTKSQVEPTHTCRSVHR